VTLIDANLLLYAYNPSFPGHAVARRWLEEVLSRPDPVRLAWVTVLAFLRIATSTRAFEHPLSIEEAIAIVSEWLSLPQMSILHPGDRHWEILSAVLPAAQVRGALVADAHLAALALEHGATLCSSDRDFARFRDLRIVNPLEVRS
jgi:toxin-antitoxin system PIN domain toxin